MTSHCLGEQEFADPGSARSVESEKNCTNPNKKAREIHIRAVRKTTAASGMKSTVVSLACAANANMAATTAAVIGLSMVNLSVLG
jgi:hypothetical protein